jgi:hypothetical protein
VLAFNVSCLVSLASRPQSYVVTTATSLQSLLGLCAFHETAFERGQSTLERQTAQSPRDTRSRPDCTEPKKQSLTIARKRIQSRNHSTQQTMSDQTREKATLFVGGLDSQVTAQTLHDAFIPFGEIADISLPKPEL